MVSELPQHMSSSTSSSMAPSILSSITVRLNHTNFMLWQAQMLTHLRGHSLLGYIDGSIEAPEETIASTNTAGESVDVVNPDYATWYVRDQTVLGGFLSTVTKEVLAHIMNARTARAAWLILERMFASRSRARVIQIRSQLTSAKKKGIPAADYFHNMKTGGYPHCHRAAAPRR
uniref:Uncharacterized protein n=1 Tax=Avena sativa TaxID=4498 RepID=A0ACD6AMF3_AVESA